MVMKLGEAIEQPAGAYGLMEIGVGEGRTMVMTKRTQPGLDQRMLLSHWAGGCWNKDRQGSGAKP
jgi:hypothetical protein